MKKHIIIFASIILAYMLTGCMQKNQIQESKIAVESDAEYLVTQHIVDSIHFYDVRKRESKDMPVVILQHGMNGEKDDMFALAQTFVDMGYLVIVPDAVSHGENQRIEGISLVEVMKETAARYDSIREYYRSDEDVKYEEFSLAGMSMGAMTTFYYGAYSENTPKCIISLYGIPKWEGLLGSDEIYTENIAGKWTLVTDGEKRKKHVAEILQNDPANNLEYLLRIPILMINGEKDEIVPISAVKAILAEANLYDNKIASEIHEQQGHDIANGDIDLAKEFLKENMPS